MNSNTKGCGTRVLRVRSGTLVTANWLHTPLGFETVEPSVHNWNQVGLKTCTEGVCVACKGVFFSLLQIISQFAA